jgi:hypothetical protein
MACVWTQGKAWVLVSGSVEWLSPFLGVIGQKSLKNL